MTVELVPVAHAERLEVHVEFPRPRFLWVQLLDRFPPVVLVQHVLAPVLEYPVAHVEDALRNGGVVRDLAVVQPRPRLLGKRRVELLVVDLPLDDDACSEPAPKLRLSPHVLLARSLEILPFYHLAVVQARRLNRRVVRVKLRELVRHRVRVLPEENHVGRNRCTCVFEGRVWHTVRAKELRSLAQILPERRE